MMSSASSPVRETLDGFVAGRVTAQRVVAVVTAEYYGERGAGSRERLRPMMDVIEQAHPGVVDLAGTTDRPGFAVRLAERPFPKEYEGRLRDAAQAVLARGASPAPGSPFPAPGLWSRLSAAIRRVFSASA
ncbi:MAG: hypothetical protein ACREL9_09625 [Gemmatimonadales bacterium]